MSSLTGRSALAACALLLIGCVSGASADDGEVPGSAGAASSAGRGAAGGQAMTGGSGATGALGGAAVGGQPAFMGAGGAMACSSYVDDAAWSLRVHIENKRATTIYLGQETMGCNERLFQVADGSRADLKALDACHPSCQQMMDTGPVACPVVCESPSTLKLDPGQAIDIPWDGRFGVDFTLPQACLRGAVLNPARCVRAQQIKNGLFTFSARAGTEHQCLAGAASCTCTPSPSGGCVTPASLITGDIITTQLILQLEPGQTSTGVQSAYIGLVFKPE